MRPYQIRGRWYQPAEQPDYDEVGLASWYGEQFHGRPTANGEMFDMHALTAAHKTLPLPSLVEVTNLANGRRIVLRVNDRGPFVDDRIIDLSRGAAEALGMLQPGRGRGAGPLSRAARRASAAEPRCSTPTRPAPPPAVPPIASAIGGYWLQAGAFSRPAAGRTAGRRATGSARHASTAAQRPEHVPRPDRARGTIAQRRRARASGRGRRAASPTPC